MSFIDDEDTSRALAVLRQEIETLKNRNTQVDRNKAWETSWTRRSALVMVTYITMVGVFYVIGSATPLRDALVPTSGYFLSTLSLPYVRRVWEHVRYPA